MPAVTVIRDSKITINTAIFHFEISMHWQEKKWKATFFGTTLLVPLHIQYFKVY